VDESYQLEKSLWTNNDFELMGWHDSPVYAISFKDFGFHLDIDYIFKWVKPEKEEIYFKFWISPCTLIFENVSEMKFDFSLSVPSNLIISDITRINEQPTPNSKFIEYDWVIEVFDEGNITFKSTGYQQHVRQTPILTDNQEVDLETRGGISFNKTSI
jgi:hypothetical protein